MHMGYVSLKGDLIKKNIYKERKLKEPERL